ncbi:MAG TPA: nitroreductase family protein [Thermomicrobiales bacterium]|nr:nitroreductase family protein [Thermomicrobiales bacterium]
MSDAPEYPVAGSIARRFSSRRFATDPLSDDTIETLLEAARWAPSYGNRQPWRFIVAREATVLDAVRETLTRGNAYAKAAPILIALCGAPEDGQIVDGKEHYLMDGGLALENLLLQATELGLHTHPMGGFDEVGVRAALGIPRHVRVLALTAVGLPGAFEDLDERTLERELRPRDRKPLDEVRSYDRWSWE